MKKILQSLRFSRQAFITIGNVYLRSDALSQHCGLALIAAILRCKSLNSWKFPPTLESD